MQRDDLLLRVREGEKLGLRLRPKEKYAGNWRRPAWMCGRRHLMASALRLQQKSVPAFLVRPTEKLLDAFDEAHFSHKKDERNQPQDECR